MFLKIDRAREVGPALLKGSLTAVSPASSEFISLSVTARQARRGPAFGCRAVGRLPEPAWLFGRCRRNSSVAKLLQLSGGATMKRLFAFATVLLLAAPAWADWDDGRAAYDRGDYDTAIEEFLPYAKQGNAKAQ